MILYFDGGCKPNPGEMVIAVVDENTEVIRYDHIGEGTNNVAEWSAFILAVEFAVRFAGEHTIIGDSKLVISQATGQWKIKDARMKEMYDMYKCVVEGHEHRLTLKHQLRDHNLAGKFLELQGW